MLISPAQWIIKVFGGVRATARKLNADKGQISRWLQPEEKKGTGGGIPRKKQLLILEIAEKEGLDITAQDLIKGRQT